jgi:hypothetical protein
VAISVVQSKAVLNPGSAAGSFSTATTAGNCVVVILLTYATTNVTVSTSGVTLGGSADNFAQAAHVQSAFASSDTQYVSIWADPNCAGGQTAVAATVTNGTWINGAGLILLELSGVATSSPVDVTSTGSATTGTAVTSGTTSATGTANELAVGAAYPDNGLSAESGTYTNILLGSSSPYTGAAGYLALASSGSATSYTGTGSASGVWAAAVITLKPASTSATVNGVTAAMTLAAPAGTPAVVTNATVAGTVSALSLAAYPGLPTSSTSLPGTVSSLALAALPGAVVVSYPRYAVAVYNGLYPQGYLQYTDLGTGLTLVAQPGSQYTLTAASGWKGLITIPPSDGLWAISSLHAVLEPQPVIPAPGEIPAHFTARDALRCRQRAATPAAAARHAGTR